MCHNGVCTHVFEVSSSFCHPSTNITVSVFATSTLGPGEPSEPFTIGELTTVTVIITFIKFTSSMTDSQNNVFHLDTVLDADKLSITCMFVSPLQAVGERSCKVLFGTGQENRCNNLSHSLAIQRNEVKVLHLSVNVSSVLEMMYSKTICFVVVASNGMLTAETEMVLSTNLEVPGADNA